jgi:hypothetical protein
MWETTKDNVRELYSTQVRTRSSEFYDQIRVEVDSSTGPRICVCGDTWINESIRLGRQRGTHNYISGRAPGFSSQHLRSIPSVPAGDSQVHQRSIQA